MRMCNIKTIDISSLTNNRIVVDVSSYLYIYKADDALIANMTKHILLYTDNYITPIFVFDGKPKEIKNRTLQIRQKEKAIARTTYDSLENASETTMKQLKKKFTKISRQDVIQVKELMDSMGIQYIQAPNEADEICARMMLTDKTIRVVVSDDTDMLLNGCPRVVRCIDLNTGTGMYYNLKHILKCLHMRPIEFKQLCVISGTDYYETPYNLYHYIRLFRQYKKSTYTDYYNWLESNGHLPDRHQLMLAFDMFDAIKSTNLDTFIPRVQSPPLLAWTS